jgi:hypothetical protein
MVFIINTRGIKIFPSLSDALRATYLLYVYLARAPAELPELIRPEIPLHLTRRGIMFYSGRRVGYGRPVDTGTRGVHVLF